MSAPGSPLQSFFRLTIMVGTAVVGGMALKVYGPPPEKIGPMLDQAMAFAERVRSEVMADKPAAEPAPAAPAAAPPAAPVFADARQAWSPEPSAAPQPMTPVVATPPLTNRSSSVHAAVASDPSLEPLVARLELAGVDQLELATWGADGQLVRCSCTAPVAGSAFRRMLDTIENNPRTALHGLLIRVQSEGAIAQAY